MKGSVYDKRVPVWAKAGLVLVALLISWLHQEREAWAVYKYCATYTPTYLDSNKGEDYLIVPQGQVAKMAYHYYQFRNAQDQIVISGYFDVNGCATTTTSVGTGQLRIWPLVKRGTDPDSMVIRAKLHSETETMSYTLKNYSNASSPGAAVTTITNAVGSFMSDFFRATAVATSIPISLLSVNQDWTIVVQADQDVECGGAGACAGTSGVWLGQDENGVWHNQRKTVIAHEVGHLVQEAMFGFWSSVGAGSPGDYSDSASNTTYCTCWYVANPDDRAHCMTSREFLTAAFDEGFAHFVGSRALNNSTQADAVYPYYKQQLHPASLQLPGCGPGNPCSWWNPPVSHNVITTHRWLENQCTVDTIAHRGTEMDWLGLLYNLNVSQAYSGSDMKSIMLNANTCGASCTGADVIEWTELNSSVNSQGGFSAAKKAKFNDQSIAFGAKR